MELSGDMEAMFGMLKQPGQSIVVAKDGRGFEQMQDLRSFARRIGLRDKTAFQVEDCGDNIEIFLMNIAPGSPLIPHRGPWPTHHAWHDLEIGRWLVLPTTDVKNIASLRVKVSKWASENSKTFSVIKVSNGYRIWRRT